jgi:hypothetical protein
MPDHDQLTDCAELRELRDSLAGVTMAGRPRLAAITAKGRAHRRHRLAAAAGVSVAGVAAGTALALGLTGVFARAQAPARFQTTAFTLASNPDGTASLTIHPGELFDAAALQDDLAQYGIPAKVTSGSFCTSDPPPADFSQVVSFWPPGPGTVQANSGVDPTITIDPSALPAGAELSFGNFQLTSGQLQADVTLIDSDSYTCRSTPPDLSGPPDNSQTGILYGGRTGP